MIYKILSWNAFRIKPTSQLQSARPLVVFGNVSQTIIDELKKQEIISVQIANTNLYDYQIPGQVINTTDDGRVFLLLNTVWNSYPYEDGNIEILPYDTRLHPTAPVQKFSNMCIKTHETNNSIQKPECNVSNDIFKFRRSFEQSTKGPNYRLTPEIISYINKHSIV